MTLLCKFYMFLYNRYIIHLQYLKIYSSFGTLEKLLYLVSIKRSCSKIFNLTYRQTMFFRTPTTTLFSSVPSSGIRECEQTNGKIRFKVSSSGNLSKK